MPKRKAKPRVSFDRAFAQGVAAYLESDPEPRTRIAGKPLDYWLKRIRKSGLPSDRTAEGRRQRDLVLQAVWGRSRNPVRRALENPGRIPLRPAPGERGVKASWFIRLSAKGDPLDPFPSFVGAYQLEFGIVGRVQGQRGDVEESIWSRGYLNPPYAVADAYPIEAAIIRGKLNTYIESASVLSRGTVLKNARFAWVKVWIRPKYKK